MGNRPLPSVKAHAKRRIGYILHPVRHSLQPNGAVSLHLLDEACAFHGDYSVKLHGIAIAMSSTRNSLEVACATMNFVHGTQRRTRRQRRRRLVGRAYDMALEVARVLPQKARVLDVGCGNGFIAHHLTSILGIKVLGIDLATATDAPIEYLRYDGRQFPLSDRSFDAVLLCYVLHHTQDLRVVLGEVRRVLRDGGLVVIYEDIPARVWDRLICWIHDVQWRSRTGHCVFRREPEWASFFKSLGFEIILERPLSRWRNLAHPVSRWFYVLKSNGAQNLDMRLSTIA